MTSQARIDANRKNALLSTGPRTAEGKERTRLNGLKHGLRSDEVVLPTEDRDAFDSHLAAWMDDWKPPTETRRFLVERAAVSAWKLKRCLRNEKVRISSRTAAAVAEVNRGRETSVEAAIAALPKHPETSVALLMNSKLGVSRLLDLWTEMRNALAEPGFWSDYETQHDRLCHLMGINGRRDSEALERISHASCLLTTFHSPELADENDPPPFDEAEAEAARAMLHGLCRDRIKALDDRWDTMDDGSAEALRWVEMKCQEPQPEDAAYHRYEARLDRESRSAIGLLMKLQQTGLDLVADSESEAPSEPKSVEPEPPTEAKPTEAEPAPKPSAPSEPNGVPAQGLVTKVDRDPKGSFGVVEGSPEVPMSVGIPLSNR